MRLFELAPAQTPGRRVIPAPSLLRSEGARGDGAKVLGRKRGREMSMRSAGRRTDRASPVARPLIPAFSLTLRQASCGACPQRGLRERPEPASAKFCSRGRLSGGPRKNEPSGRSLRW
ncbi:MAG: hypothetical protein DI526_14300 [Caulobacter segnis]|uniref:Uncharacterized protein n=1 Tax=Caulobacter segnis TaxID=88688 RepID=A0A2W5VCY4_9CAUL|nr:MAG: hypothetical protein DI526_14300 [Caulobacter segnis]